MTSDREAGDKLKNPIPKQKPILLAKKNLKNI
jgi:hypothetical protein